MSNKTYDILKTIALVAVPFIAFVGSLCTIWGIPHSEQITASLTALDTFIGALVVIASKLYYAEEQDTFNDDDFLDLIEYEGDEDEDTEDLSEE